MGTITWKLTAFRVLQHSGKFRTIKFSRMQYRSVANGGRFPMSPLTIIFERIRSLWLGVAHFKNQQCYSIKAILTSLAKWLSVRLWTKWLWVRVQLLSPEQSSCQQRNTGEYLVGRPRLPTTKVIFELETATWTGGKLEIFLTFMLER